MNSVIVQNRKHQIRIVAPFSGMSKTEELEVLLELDSDVEFAGFTWTCYNPQMQGDKLLACGKCPSCSERLKAFQDIGKPDPVGYV